jgi:hypothetical protein
MKVVDSRVHNNVSNGRYGRLSQTSKALPACGTASICRGCEPVFYAIAAETVPAAETCHTRIFVHGNELLEADAALCSATYELIPSVLGFCNVLGVHCRSLGIFYRTLV